MMKAVPVFSSDRGSSTPLPFGLIPKAYRTRFRGKHARMVTRCPHCDTSNIRGAVDHKAVGIAKRSMAYPDGSTFDEAVWIWECPSCFDYYWHHLTCGQFDTYKMWFELFGLPEAPHE